MRTGRIPYTPDPLHKPAGAWLALIGFLALVGAACAAWLLIGVSAAPVATAIPQPVVEGMALEPLDAAQARIEGYRAGFEAGQQQGCRRHAPLAAPLQL